MGRSTPWSAPIEWFLPLLRLIFGASRTIILEMRPKYVVLTSKGFQTHWSKDLLFKEVKPSWMEKSWLPPPGLFWQGMVLNILSLLGDGYVKVSDAYQSDKKAHHDIAGALRWVLKLSIGCSHWWSKPSGTSQRASDNVVLASRDMNQIHGEMWMLARLAFGVFTYWKYPVPSSQTKEPPLY